MKFILLCCCASVALSAAAGDLKLRLHGDVLAGKEVHAGLFANAAEFPNGTPLRGMVARANADTVYLRFAGLPPGEYAVSVFVDSNGNGVLDKNLLGKPSEPYGFSRDARKLLGVPSFADAAFRLDDGAETVLFIHLH